MEDFQYSVDISDRDWECFFRECEECNLLPPTLAGVDESGMSGMSDIDDSGALLAKKVQKVDVPAGISGADLPIDGPPHCEGSPVDHYLSKHGVSGMESVLSGSEEDIHLQSVNIFFERLKNLTEAERPSEPSQVKAGKNREVILKEEQCSDGQQSNMSTLPKNIPKLNSLPARGETAVGKETGRPFDAISNVNTMKKVEPSSNISTDSAASIVLLKTNKSLYPETELFIREETCTETTLNEVTRQRYRPHDSLNGLVCSKAKPHSDEVKRVGTSTLLKDGAQENLLANQLNACGKCNTNLPSNLEMVTNKWKEEPYFSVSQMDGVSIRKTEGQESSPSSSIKRKRRKKRRLSFEPPESAHGYERQGLMRSSDSEEEQNIGRGGTGLCLSEDMNLFYSNESQKNFASSLYSVTSNHPARKFAPEIKVNDLSCTAPPYDSQYQYLPKSIFRQGLCKTVSSAENNATNDKPETPLSQPVDSVMSAIDYSSNIKRTLQPCIIVQVEELTRQNKYSWFPVSDCDSATGDVDITIEKTNHGTKDIDANGCEKCDKMNHSTIGGENEQNLKCFSEVKSMTQSILPSTEINDTTLEVSQNEKRSAAKSALHVEAGNFGRDDHTQRETESQQQIEDDCQGTDQCSSTVENTHALNAKSEQFKDNVCPVLEETSSKVNSIKLSSECIISSPDESCFSKNPSYLDLSDIAQQTECLLKSQTLSKLDISSEKSTTTKTAQLTALQVAEGMSPCPSEKINTTGSSLRETKLSMSADLSNSLTLEIIPVSSCDTVDTDSAVALSNENITDLSGSFSSSVSQHESGGQGQPSPLILAKHEKDDATSGLNSLSLPHDSTDSKCDLSHKAEDSVAVCKSENEPEKILDSKNSVFAMSSFWSEMEKLTINDILGLRTINNPASSFPLQPSEESEEKDLFASTDSGFVAQLDESKPKQTNVCMSSVPGSVESNLESVMAVDSSSTNSAMWESVPVQGRLRSDIYPNNMMLPSVNNISQSVFCGSAQKSLRKISKNVSVHNLRALESESLSPSQKVPTLQTIDESEKIEYFSSGHVTKQEKDMASLPSSYRISVSDIFQYLFGGKQSVSSQSATDNINTVPDGDSVPESYDHFFSEFDTETFFCPLITAEDQAKDEMVPIFSCSRSANRNLQYPEAYDYFFASSASDDSSVESEEEDNNIPVRVVTRFTRKPSATKICTDAYDSFYTDSDIEQDFFWKSTFSFRNINFTASTAQKHTPSSTSLSPVPLSQTTGSVKTLYPSNALGNQDVMFPDPLLLDLQDRIYKQQLQQPFRNEDLQIAVSNPRLDAPFLPLKQSDMCLVCIAFASWVLKTANPQVGDAWKAVLLANVSALSAIRYLRKYVKMEAADSGEKLHHIASSQT